jgi:hypothetical protein
MIAQVRTRAGINQRPNQTRHLEFESIELIHPMNSKETRKSSPFPQNYIHSTTHNQDLITNLDEQLHIESDLILIRMLTNKFTILNGIINSTIT